jgi:hypothetical protein
VTCQGDIGGGDAPAENNGTNSSGGSGDQKAVAVAQSIVMKSGDTIYEQNKGSDGTVRQIWHIKGARVEKGSDGPLNIGPDSGGGDIYSVNFQSSDFAGLDWLSADTYSGKLKYQGSDVIVFKQDVNPLRADVRKANENAAVDAKITAAIRAQRGEKAIAIATPPPVKMVPAVAYIDLKSRLPLIVTIGGEKRTYQYAPLSQAIPMPPDVAKALSDYQQRMKLLSQ